MLIVLSVKIYFARHQHDTEKNPKQSGIVAIDSCFANIILLLSIRPKGSIRSRGFALASSFNIFSEQRLFN